MGQYFLLKPQHINGLLRRCAPRNDVSSREDVGFFVARLRRPQKTPLYPMNTRHCEGATKEHLKQSRGGSKLNNFFRIFHLYQVEAKSFHSGFNVLISFSLFLRFPALIFFSYAIAFLIL